MTSPLPAAREPSTGDHLALIAAAVAALPCLPEDTARYSPRHLTAAWLYEQPRTTRRGYFKDLADWLTYCAEHDLGPTTVRPVDVGTYRADLAEAVSPTTGRPYAPTTIARRMAALSSWYKHLIANGATDSNPFASAKRPKIDRDATNTPGLTFDEACALLDAADTVTSRTGPRTKALLRLLVESGLRVGEALALDVDSLSDNQGYRTVRFIGKGGRRRERALDPHTVSAIEEYLDERAARGYPRTGPLFATERADGILGRLDEPAVFRLVRRIARLAGIPAASRLSAHSLRHAFATIALEDLPLHIVQDSMGHADPRTTRRYDRARHMLASDASLSVGRRFATRGTGRRNRRRHDEDASAGL